MQGTRRKNEQRFGNNSENNLDVGSAKHAHVHTDSLRYAALAFLTIGCHCRGLKRKENNVLGTTLRTISMSFREGFGCHFGGQVGAMLGSCWGHFGVSNKVPYKNRFLEASWSPSRAQVGLQVGPSCAQNRYLTSLKFRLRFRRDLEASRARFW